MPAAVLEQPNWSNARAKQVITASTIPAGPASMSFVSSGNLMTVIPSSYRQVHGGEQFLEPWLRSETIESRVDGDIRKLAVWFGLE